MIHKQNGTKQTSKTAVFFNKNMFSAGLLKVLKSLKSNNLMFRSKIVLKCLKNVSAYEVSITIMMLCLILSHF